MDGDGSSAAFIAKADIDRTQRAKGEK